MDSCFRPLMPVTVISIAQRCQGFTNVHSRGISVKRQGLFRCERGTGLAAASSCGTRSPLSGSARTSECRPPAAMLITRHRSGPPAGTLLLSQAATRGPHHGDDDVG